MAKHRDGNIFVSSMSCDMKPEPTTIELEPGEAAIHFKDGAVDLYVRTHSFGLVVGHEQLFALGIMTMLNLAPNAMEQVAGVFVGVVNSELQEGTIVCDNDDDRVMTLGMAADVCTPNGLDLALGTELQGTMKVSIKMEEKDGE